MLRKLYLSPLGFFISVAMNWLAAMHRPFMVYGYKDAPSGTWRKLTRISSSASIIDKANVSIGDNVWIWHHSIIDGSNGVTIGEGAQIGAWVGIFSHGSQVSIRLYGRDYISVDRTERKGYSRGAVEIGSYAFIGAHAIILPGVKVGKGALVAAGALVNRDVPDFAVVAGNPARVVGDTRKMDEQFWDDPDIERSYFDREAREQWLKAKLH